MPRPMAKRSRKKAQFTGNGASDIRMNCNMQPKSGVFEGRAVFQE
jgi:hypothetical protein